jgi:hypothetical protein
MGQKASIRARMKNMGLTTKLSTWVSSKKEMRTILIQLMKITLKNS